MTSINIENRVPSEDELALAIEVATRSALSELLATHKERFYYFSLVTTGEAHSPAICAWSIEALKSASQQAALSSEALRWSYADSPYLGFGEHHFDRVKQLFAMRPQIDHSLPASQWQDECDVRLRSMELAMRRLDEQGLFGTGSERLQILINAEVMPPDKTNSERAARLNPQGALVKWLEEAAE